VDALVRWAAFSRRFSRALVKFAGGRNSKVAPMVQYGTIRLHV
jgi:hypothetical protein